jgi:hypothetical protein
VLDLEAVVRGGCYRIGPDLLAAVEMLISSTAEFGEILIDGGDKKV